MANFSALKTAIQNAIKQNGNEEITGDVLQQILLSIVSTMGDGAINTIEQNLSNETTNRQGADTQLQNAINAIKANIDNGYVYAGIAKPSTTPVSGKVFYAALQAGTYTNFGGTAVTEGITFLKHNGTSWTKEQVLFNLSLTSEGMISTTVQEIPEYIKKLRRLQP
jgi:phosphoglucomutase